jgi:hypothetical protein
MIAGYKALQDQLMAHWENMDPSFKPDLPLGAKMIVKMNDTETIEAVLISRTFQKFAKENKDVQIFFITSKHGAVTKSDNEEYFSYNTLTKKTREIFLEEINDLKDHEKAIIFHIRILREGIDVSGINGIYFTSWTDIIDFLQNFGRSVRLHPVDRKNLDKGIIKPDEYNKMIKPCGWIILPRLNPMDQDLIDATKEILRELKNNWGYIPNHLTNITTYSGNDDNSDDDVDTGSNSDHNPPVILEPNQNFVAEIWEEVLENGALSLEELMNVVNSNKISDMAEYGRYRSRAGLIQQMPYSPREYYSDYPGDENFFYNFNIWPEDKIYKFIKDNDLENPIKAVELNRSILPSNFPKSIRRFMKKFKK